MAKDLALDTKTMDIAWPPHYVSGKEEVQQAILGLIMTKKGSFLDYPNVGMDYNFLINRYNPDELRIAVTKAIKEDRRVTHIENVKIETLKNHRARVIANVDTTLGKIGIKQDLKRGD